MMESNTEPSMAKIGKKGYAVAYDYDKYRAYYLKKRESILAYKDAYQRKNREKTRSYKTKWRKNNSHKLKKIGFFMSKAYSMIDRINDNESCPRKLSQGLMAIWLNQKGRCALSGRKLDRKAHVDHKLPVSRGGSNCLSNLQFLSPEVNQAKSSLTDSEFIQLCMEVVKHAKIDEYPV
jgi:5-methylcytosine-specific restriction endonuclease McrA